MTKAGWSRRAAPPLLALLLVGFAIPRAGAQATIRGKVVTEQGVALHGASVTIQGLGLGSATNESGNYTIVIPENRANGQRAVLVARFIGFQPQHRPTTLTAEAQTQDFTLKADPFRLDEVVVTGVAGATEAKKLTFSVARISEDQVKEVPASSPIAALAGKVSGARISIGQGNPGADPAIRLRASTNLTTGGSEPMIIVDGVITRASIADIDANDIESIEVLKGAAAASFYGSNAANGVIQITTKRGKSTPDGSVSWSVRSEYGQSGLQHFVPLSQHHYFVLNADGTIQTNSAGNRVVKTNGIADNPFPVYHNQLKEWMTNGEFYNTNLQLGLRRGNTNFATSYTTDRNGGVLPMTKGQFRNNVRFNVDQGLGTNVDLSASITYGLNKNDLDPTSSAAWFALLQAPPDLDLRQPNGNDTIPFFPRLPSQSSPNARGNPLYQLANEDYSLRRERIIGSFSARYRPFEFLRLEGSYGTDRLNEQEKTYRFRGYLGSGGTPTNGSLTRASRNNVAWNAQVNATATHMFFSELLSTTRVAALQENTNNFDYTAGGTKLNVSEVPDLAAVDPTQITINSGESVTRTTDYMASQAFDFRDRYLIDVLYRRDGSSLFGADARWADFYRVSGGYRISEDFKIPGVQELKLRAARGTAGLRPMFNAQYETYTVTAGTISKQQVGNRNLKPAIQTEDEFGINTTFLNRFDLEVVQANRVTRGAFLNVPLSPAQNGGFTQQVQNAADVTGRTTELSFQTRVIDRRDFSYSFSLTGDHTTQRISKMNRAPFRVNATNQQGQDAFYYKEGEVLGIIYGTRWVRTLDELKDNPANASINLANYVVNPAGYVVLASTRGLPTERPIQYISGTTTQFKIGDVNPDFSFGFSNNIRYKGFNVYALLDGQRGGDIYNFTKQWMFQDFRHAEQDQSGKDASQQIPLNFYAAGLYNGLVANDHFVEDGSYVKLRELSVSYNLTPRVLQLLRVAGKARSAKLALIGRNLYTWTNYSGFDPEVTAGQDFNFRIDGFRYPQFRTITGQIEVTF